MRLSPISLRVTLGLGVFTTLAALAQKPATPKPAIAAADAAPQQAMVDQYCIMCHSEQLKTAGVVLEGVHIDRVGENTATYPAKYHAGLIARVRQADVTVAGNSPVTAIQRNSSDFTVTTPRTSLQARNVVVATNGYTGSMTPGLRRRVIPVTSYMIATAPLSPNLMATLMPKGRMLSDSNRLLCYFRPSPDNTRVLFGGRPAYTEIGAQLAAERLTRYMTRIFPELDGVELTHSWFGFIAYTFDRLPHVGERDGMHYAMGYCGSGVVMSTWLGRKAALRLLGEQEGGSAFAELGHPTSPFYYGKPWFLPFVQAWYQGADMLGH